VSAGWRLKVGLGLMAVLLLASVLYEPLAQLSFLPACPFGPDPTFPATDTVCGRTLVGLRRSVGVGVLAGGAAAAGALALALVARRFGRGADLLVEKVADLFFTLPDVLVLILIGFAVGLLQDAWAGFRPPPFLVVVLSLTLVGWAAPTRQIQNRLRSLEGQDFVLAARAVGAGRWRILVRHLLPFAWDYVLAIFLLRVPATILAESTVSFLGFGLPPREASLGTFVGLNYTTMMRGAWGVLLPALVLLFLVVVAFQWTGQGALARAAGRDG
jgi:ABC-type dipeptide/oligopeptide/nickel transport system permease subunit